MKLKKLNAILGLLVVLSMVLSACGGATATTEATQAPAEVTAEPTEAPAAAAPQTERHGGWLDEIDLSVVSADSALSQLQAGTIDFFSFNLASDAYPAIKEANLPSTQPTIAFKVINNFACNSRRVSRSAGTVTSSLITYLELFLPRYVHK